MTDPVSIEDWIALGRTHRLAAERLSKSRHTSQQAVFHAGLAVECLIKALIIRVERLNAWPSRSARPEVYTHNLRSLSAVAKIALLPTSPCAAEWSVVLQWDRNQGYDPDPMPRSVAKSFLEAAFGQDGVSKWLKTQIR